MTAKVYKTVLLLCTITTIALFSSSCAEKSDPILEEEPEEEVVEELIQPELSWADGIVTITVGRYQTGDDLVDAIQNKPNFWVARSTPTSIHRANIRMSQERKTVDITVVTLEEAGFSGNPVTLEQIISRFQQLGYRPLTIEEALEFRLQFTDQPDVTQADLTEEERKWGDMFALLSVQDALSLCIGNSGKMTGKKDLLSIYRNVLEGFGAQFGIATYGADEGFDPHIKSVQVKLFDSSTWHMGSNFACAIIK